MKGYCDDIEKATLANEDFRRVLYTGQEPPAGADDAAAGLRHRRGGARGPRPVLPDRGGRGRDPDRRRANQVEDDFAVIVPAGARHNVSTRRRAAQALHASTARPSIGRRRPQDQGAGRARPRQRPLGRRDDGIRPAPNGDGHFTLRGVSPGTGRVKVTVPALHKRPLLTHMRPAVIGRVARGLVVADRPDAVRMGVFELNTAAM